MIIINTFVMFVYNIFLYIVLIKVEREDNNIPKFFEAVKTQCLCVSIETVERVQVSGTKTNIYVLYTGRHLCCSNCEFDRQQS